MGRKSAIGRMVSGPWAEDQALMQELPFYLLNKLHLPGAQEKNLVYLKISHQFKGSFIFPEESCHLIMELVVFLLGLQKLGAKLVSPGLGFIIKTY